MTKLVAALLFSLAAVISCSSAFAATGDKDAYNAELDRADSDYKAAKDKCGSFAGNANDVCLEQAKLERTRTKAGAKAAYENTAKAHTNAVIDIADAQYSVDKQKCKDLAGNDRDVCVKQAQANRDTAKAQAKAGKEIAESRSDVAQAKNDGDYKVAIEKCDSLAGPSKDSCVAAAKNQYGK